VRGRPPENAETTIPRASGMPDEKSETVRIDFEFRRKLDEIVGGDHHNYCYQCGACVAQCPAAKYNEQFNPRQILLDTLLGRSDELLGPDSPIWLCTNCYSCYERCPQDVRPIEVIIALKNMASELGKAPKDVTTLTENITKAGVSGIITPTVHKMRAELGLDPIGEFPVDEMLKLLED
jgi:heterodisulfide reductase subunit C